MQKKPQEARRYSFGFLSVYLPGVASSSILKGLRHLIFDGDAPREVQASRPLQKGKGRAATSLGAVQPDKQKQKQNQKQKRVGELFQLWYVVFGFPASAPAQVLLL